MKTKPLRIALISEHASPLALPGGSQSGGLGVCVNHIARALAAAGHRVDVLTRRDDPAVPALVELRRNARVLQLDAGPATPLSLDARLGCLPAFTEAARRLLQRSAPYDVLHAHHFTSGSAALTLRQRLSLPLVTTLHALGLVRREHHAPDAATQQRINIERQLVQCSDRLIAQSPQEENELMHLYGAAPEAITNVPWGVDADMFRPGDRAGARQRLGLDPAAFIALHVGRLAPRKGLDDVLQALALLPAGSLAQLQVVGGDSATPDPANTDVQRLRALAQQLGVGARLHFAGWRGREALRDWYLAADVLVSAPWYEPFGLVPLEAMACGTPVLGTAVGGVQYTVADGVTGYLVPPHNPRALADRLLHLQQNPALAATLGRAGTRRVRSQFNWDAAAQRLLRVYERVRQQQAQITTTPAAQPVPVAPVAVRTLQQAWHSVVPAPG